VYSDAGSEGAFGETLFFDLISADPRDRHAAHRLRETLFEWGLNLHPSGCPFFDYLQQHPIAFVRLLVRRRGALARHHAA
jgi:hypothetical protein